MDTIEIAEMAEILKCSEASIEAALRDGTLPSIQLGRHHVTPRAAFWQRVAEVAIEQAANRRSERQPVPAPAPAPVPKAPRRRPLISLP